MFFFPFVYCFLLFTASCFLFCFFHLLGLCFVPGTLYFLFLVSCVYYFLCFVLLWLLCFLFLVSCACWYIYIFSRSLFTPGRCRSEGSDVDPSISTGEVWRLRRRSRDGEPGKHSELQSTAAASVFGLGFQLIRAKWCYLFFNISASAAAVRFFGEATTRTHCALLLWRRLLVLLYNTSTQQVVFRGSNTSFKHFVSPPSSPLSDNHVVLSLPLSQMRAALMKGEQGQARPWVMSPRPLK